MPRRQFVADLEKAKTDVLPIGITNVKAGDDDGQVEFIFTGGPNGLPFEPVRITALVPDLGDYPKTHEYMIFADDDAPRDISGALSNMRGTNRKTVFELLDIVSTTLTRISPDKDGDSQMQDDFEQYEDEDDENVYDSDHEAFEMPVPSHNAAYAAQAPSPVTTNNSTRAFRTRIRSDFNTAKRAGFKLGFLGHLMEAQNCYVTIAIRISKLGISEEAMQAWQVEPSDYLTLIIQYPNGYKTNEQLQGFDNLRLAPNLAMRVVAGRSYKPTLQEAIKAFTTVRREDRTSLGGTSLPPPEDTEAEESSIRETFISKPLVTLMTDQLIPLLRYRSAGLDWQGAEEFYRQQVQTSSGSGNGDIIPDRLYEPEVLHDALPDIVKADHYTAPSTTQYSFPLLAMQFLLRHFVRCTDFCLVCHRKLDTEVEAIKPYVCDNGLCLYQYMSLGFGPSIEHEIIAQAYVCDLLVSLCYNSAAARKIKDFPEGLSLQVPPVDESRYSVSDPSAYYRGRAGATATPKKTASASDAGKTKFEVGFDRARREIIFWDSKAGCPVTRGSWIVLNSDSIGSHDLHCRVVETTFFPSITIGEPVEIKQQHAQDPSVPGAQPQTPTATRPASPAVTPAPNWADATFQVYDTNFDTLDQDGKCLSICRILDTLPTVLEMRDYLTKRHPADLKHWSDRISPSALTLLRWIIASNRSHILQVDGDAKVDKDGNAISKKTNVFSREQERVYGMKDYMQFRFAMGAPDKEQRFITEVKNTTQRLNLQCPTLFAWHGSPLCNWHMIIREGLHYKSVDHGRAYGDGVYHAKEAQTSVGYSGMYSASSVGHRMGTWPGSVLRISMALALNEIVNAPAEFTSQTPFYVVKQLDWIQTRYLFVQCAPTSQQVAIGAEKKPQNAHPQDSSCTPRGVGNDLVIIPASAIKSAKTARGARSTEGTSPKNPVPSKKLKLFGGASNPIPLDEDDDDTASVATDVADLEVLIDEPPEPVPEPAPSKPVKKIVKASKTDFVPGSLDFCKLPIMPLPEYAVPSTTKRLMKELQNLAKVQDATPLAELGWYIDIDKIENVYQWIVELHSFHKFEIKGKPLPLAEDMKKHNVQSMVLEVRFNKDFPFSPPYVRVIRPRCLPLSMGGGGHIVIGGAMCMELLTNTGWSSVSTMESVLLQIRLAIASEPYARLEGRSTGDYGVGEAAEGYIRACAAHNWQVPPGFKEMALGAKGQPSHN